MAKNHEGLISFASGDPFEEIKLFLSNEDFSILVHKKVHTFLYVIKIIPVAVRVP